MADQFPGAIARRISWLQGATESLLSLHRFKHHLAAVKNQLAMPALAGERHHRTPPCLMERWQRSRGTPGVGAAAVGGVTEASGAVVSQGHPMKKSGNLSVAAAAATASAGSAIGTVDLRAGSED